MGSTYPFVHTIIFTPDNLFKPLLLISYSVLLFICIRKNHLILPKRDFTLAILIQILFLIFHSLVFHSDNSLYVAFISFQSWIFVFFILNTIGILTFICGTFWVNIGNLLFLIIGLFLLLCGFLSVYDTYSYGDMVISDYLFFIVKHHDDISEMGDMVRSGGYYDEPGSLAYVVMLLLLINHKYYKSRFFEYFLLIFPLVTTSLAHIITSLLYIVFFVVKKKNILKVFSIVTCVFVIAIYIYKLDIGNNGVSLFLKMTVGRIENVVEGNIDPSRGDGYELGPTILKSNPLGMSAEVLSGKYPSFTKETAWYPILVYGFWGVLFFYFPIVLSLVKSLYLKNVTELLYICIIAVNLGQRPHYNYPFFLILIYVLLFNKKLDEESNACFRHSPRSYKNGSQ